MEKFRRVIVPRDDVTTRPLTSLISVAIEDSQLNPPATVQAKGQQHYRVVARETGLRLRAAAELLVDTLERVVVRGATGNEKA